MQILVASDLHYELPHYDWLLDQAGDFDVLALVGDHLSVASAVPLSAQIVVISQYLERLGQRTTVVTCSGNHDLDGPGAEGEQVAGWLRRLRINGVHVDGARLDVGGIRFTICPWWDGPRTRDLVEAQLEAEAADRPARWVWIYHSPPEGTSLCWTGSKSFPDKDLARWIERFRPDLVLCGHIHQAPGQITCICCAQRRIG